MKNCAGEKKGQAIKSDQDSEAERIACTVPAESLRGLILYCPSKAVGSIGPDISCSMDGGRSLPSGSLRRRPRHRGFSCQSWRVNPRAAWNRIIPVLPRAAFVLQPCAKHTAEATQLKFRPEEALFTCFPTTPMYTFFFKDPVDDPHRNLGTRPPGYRSQQESSG